MTRRSKYLDIKTLDALDEAIRENRSQIGKQGAAVGESFGTVQSFYTPQNLALQGVRKAALNVNFYANALRLVRTLKKALKK